MANRIELSQEERASLAIKLANVSTSDRKRKIFSSKYGLLDGVTKSNAKTGKLFRITGEAVRLVCKDVQALITK